MPDRTVPPFYDPPDPLPTGKPGELIRSEPVEAPAGLRAWRILYHSRALDGADTAVSGLVAAPEGAAPAGGFPLLAMAHGTTGVNRTCAPSIAPALVNQQGLSVYGTIKPYVDAGYVVAATDYQGLGASGAPAYLIGVVEGRNVLDAARAARALPDLALVRRTFVWGHSQGGHAASFAGQIAAAYAPDLPLTGVVLLAPAAELELMALGLALVQHPLPGVAFLVMAVYAWSLNYPDATLSTVLTPAGLQTVETLRENCGLEMYPPFETHPPHHYFKPVGVAMSHVWRSVIAENVPGQAPIGAPVFVAQGSADRIVPPLTTELFVHRLGAKGDRVGLTMYPDADHLSLLNACRPDVLAWMASR